jgi:hypothetical protein
MFVIFLVTTDAGGGGRHFLVHPFGMAGITIQPFVPAIQLEFGPGIVIEVPDFPVADIVAALALRS